MPFCLISLLEWPQVFHAQQRTHSWFTDCAKVHLNELVKKIHKPLLSQLTTYWIMSHFSDMPNYIELNHLWTAIFIEQLYLFLTYKSFRYVSFFGNHVIYFLSGEMDLTFFTSCNSELTHSFRLKVTLVRVTLISHGKNPWNTHHYMASSHFKVKRLCFSFHKKLFFKCLSFPQE